MRTKICCWAIILLAATQIFCGCGGNTNAEEKLLRIYVRADSDAAAAQAVNAQVSAAVAYYLNGELENCRTYAEAYAAVRARTNTVAHIADGVLRAKGYGYGAKAALTHISAQSGECDALIVRLGTGNGDGRQNVLYPVSADTSAKDGAVYKSLIAEIIGKRL